MSFLIYSLIDYKVKVMDGVFNLGPKMLVWGRVLTTALILYGFGGDCFISTRYEAFDRSLATPYVVKVDEACQRRRPKVYVFPSQHYSVGTFLGPKGGDVVLGRVYGADPNWFQMLNGRFLEMRTCGVELLRPLDEVELEKAQQQRVVDRYREKLGC